MQGGRFGFGFSRVGSPRPKDFAPELQGARTLFRQTRIGTHVLLKLANLLSNTAIRIIRQLPLII
jgi:hypothetical protein